MSIPEVTLLPNSNKMSLLVSNFGATIMSLKVPNKNEQLVDVVVGLATVSDYTKEEYLNKNLCLGSSIGRYAGRISNGGFKIEGKTYPLHHANKVHLHGGHEGFDKKYWTIEEVVNGNNPFVTLSYLSKHLEEGYPGNLKVSVTYKLTEENELKIIYKATTDKTTHVNLTNHSYFNLNGTGSILNHDLSINSDRYLEVDSQLIPTGRILNSKNTPFDFNIKSKIDRPDFQGLDDTFILNKTDLKASLSSKETGIKMDVFTNQPAIVVFTPSFKQISGLSFRKGVIYSEFPAICFETQNFPDAPNHPHFPPSTLNPKETYLNESHFKFSILD